MPIFLKAWITSTSYSVRPRPLEHLNRPLRRCDDAADRTASGRSFRPPLGCLMIRTALFTDRLPRRCGQSLHLITICLTTIQKHQPKLWRPPLPPSAKTVNLDGFDYALCFD